MPTEPRRFASAKTWAADNVRRFCAAVVCVGLLAGGCDEFSSSGDRPSNLERLRAANAKAKRVAASQPASAMPLPQPTAQPIDISQAASGPAVATPAADRPGGANCKPHVPLGASMGAPAGDVGGSPD